MEIEESEPFSEARRNMGGVPDGGETFQEFFHFDFVAGVNAAAQAADDGFELNAEQHVSVEIDEDSAMLGVDNVVEWLVATEDGGGK